MIAPRLSRLSHLTDRRVLVRCILGRKVGQSGQLAVELGANRGLLITQFPPTSGERRQLLPFFSRRRALTPAAGLVLLGAQLLGPRRELTPLAVELQNAVDARGGIGAAAGKRCSNGVGIAADQPYV
jgi:hypothetical protein